MEYESRVLSKIRNLNAVAHCHRNDCHNANCGVSLWLLKDTAEQLSLGLIDPKEIQEYKKLKWPS